MSCSYFIFISIQCEIRNSLKHVVYVRYTNIPSSDILLKTAILILIGPSCMGRKGERFNPNKIWETNPNRTKQSFTLMFIFFYFLLPATLFAQTIIQNDLLINLQTFYLLRGGTSKNLYLVDVFKLTYEPMSKFL